MDVYETVDTSSLAALFIQLIDLTALCLLLPVHAQSTREISILLLRTPQAVIANAWRTCQRSHVPRGLQELCSAGTLQMEPCAAFLISMACMHCAMFTSTGVLIWSVICDFATVYNLQCLTISYCEKLQYQL